MIFRRSFSAAASSSASKVIVKQSMAASASGSSGSGITFDGSSTAESVLQQYGRTVEGKTVFVTGATSGIGLETARCFVKAGARVFMAGRNAKKLHECIDIVRQEQLYFAAAPIDPEKVVPMICDVSSLASVRKCVDEFKAFNVPLDVLVNNAGCWLTNNPARVFTEDGFEMHLGTNHFGHFALTNGLLPSLKAAGRSRVVNVSSVAHGRCAIKLDDLNFEKSEYDQFSAYGHSKTANILHAVALHEKYYADGVTAVSLHPGVIDTDLWRDGQIGARMNKTIPQGAATQVWCAVCPDVISGIYYDNCAAQSSVKPYAVDKGIAMRFWDISMELTQIEAKK